MGPPSGVRVGRAANYAAKLTEINLAERIWITEDVYEALYQDSMIGTDHRLMAEARMRARAVARSLSAMSCAQVEWVLDSE